VFGEKEVSMQKLNEVTVRAIGVMCELNGYHLNYVERKDYSRIAITKLNRNVRLQPEICIDTDGDDNFREAQVVAVGYGTMSVNDMKEYIGLLTQANILAFNINELVAYDPKFSKESEK
jgi:hypothetical protein